MADERKFVADWESVGPALYRIPAPGGWLYMYESAGESQDSTAMCYVPEPGNIHRRLAVADLLLDTLMQLIDLRKDNE